MSKPSARPGREDAKTRRRESKRLGKELRKRQRAAGLEPFTPPALPNATSAYASVAQEQQARQDALVGQLQVLRAQLPTLLGELSKIPDPRHPKKITHQKTMLFLYGLLMFVFQLASRRQANQQMTQPQFEKNLRLLLPELDTLPHADTLYRLLRDVEDVRQIEQAQVALLRQLIRKKKFRRYLINNCYPIAIDGTQKLSWDSPWSAQALQRQVGKDATQYYVYVLEANLAFQNGMTLPLLSEFLEFSHDDIEFRKQDCELRAFQRLSERLKQLFPRLPILLLLDGLYANGPVMEQCQKHHWQFMIVLQDKSLPSLWEEAQELKAYQGENRRQQTWGNRYQRFWWVNDLTYYYGPNGRHHLTVHLVVCAEQWEENDNGQIVTKTSRHAWLSSRRLNRYNLHERCNLGARHRWGIETSNLVEKHHGYHYEHCFSYDWNAMKGYHYLMRLAHLINTLARYSQALAKHYAQMGVRGFLQFVRNTCSGPWLNPEQVREALNREFQLRLP